MDREKTVRVIYESRKESRPQRIRQQYSPEPEAGKVCLKLTYDRIYRPDRNYRERFLCREKQIPVICAGTAVSPVIIAAAVSGALTGT